MSARTKGRSPHQEHRRRAGGGGGGDSQAEPVVVDVREADVSANIHAVEHPRIRLIRAVPADLQETDNTNEKKAIVDTDGGAFFTCHLHYCTSRQCNKPYRK